jgi:site-specific DNA-methyltransferase (adenine-specific)
MVDPQSLHPYFKNPRKGSVDAIVASLEAHGQYKPLVVNIGDLTGRPNEVLAGNHLLAAGLKLGLPEMLVHWVNVDGDEAARIVVVDNRASDLGGYDDKLLAEVLMDLGDLTGTGYNDGDLTRLLNGLGEGDAEGLTDPDAVPTIAQDTISVEGDVWLLGPHTLVCGSSTDPDVVEKAAAGGAHAMWTDPPYGVSYVGGTKDALTIQNDGADGLEQLLYDAFTSAASVLRPGAPCYIAHADTERVTFQTALENAGYVVRQNLIWVKNALVLGRSDYHYQHEPILDATAPEYSGGEEPAAAGPEPTTHEPIAYAFTPGGSGRLGRGGARWYGDNKQTTVFEVPKPTASRVHPTMKPVELIVQQLRNSVARGERVLDLFGGSGSTLIAAHQLGLYASLVELDPRYVDVICRRYQEHTGIVPVLKATGKPVTFVRTGE